MKQFFSRYFLQALLCLSAYNSLVAHAEAPVINLWTPSIQSPWNHDHTLALVNTISANTGTTVVTHASDIRDIIKACRRKQVDHSILPVVYARKLLQQCDVEVIAEAAIDISLYAKPSNKSIRRWKKIGFVKDTVSAQVATLELDVTDVSKKLVELPSNQHAVAALFSDKIDGLVINDIVMERLSRNPKNRVVKLKTFQNTGKVYFLASRALEPVIKNRLQQLYLSEDPVIARLFYGLAGLHPISKPEVVEAESMTPVLRVWGPKVRESRPDAQSPLIDKLGALTQRTVTFNVSTDVDALLEACARLEVDHALLEKSAADVVIQKYGYIPIAHATIPISLFTRADTQRPVDQLDSIGFLKRTSAYAIALKELPADGLENKLIPFEAYHQAVFALLNGDIDALIANNRFIEALDEKLKKNLQPRLRFQGLSDVYFLVSPMLDVKVAEQLQRFYLSDDPVVDDLFYRRAGLNPIQPMPLPASGDR